MDDYYNELGVSKDATTAEIKKRYRELAKKYHPDIAGKDSEQKFKDISEAYEVLSNDKLRRKYDQYGKEGLKSEFGEGGFDWSNFTHEGDLNDILKMFGFGPGGGSGFSFNFENFGSRYGFQEGQRSAMDLHFQYSVPISETLIDDPVSKTISFERNQRCDACEGRGGFLPMMTCPECRGQGVQTHSLGYMTTQVICSKCHGARQTFSKTCSSCHGRGVQKEKMSVKIDDARKYLGKTIVFRNKGNYILQKGYGSLEVSIQAHSDEEFQVINDYDLVREQSIDVFKILVGGKIKVPSMKDYKKHLILDIPPSTDFNHLNVRVPNVGLYKDSSLKSRGSLYLNFKISKIKLSDEERKILKDIRDKRDSN